MKSFRIVIDDAALSDIKEAANWYDKHGENLGSRFKKSVKQQINIIKSNADSYSVRYKNVHCALVKKFPFLIHFVIDEKNHVVKILAVIHSSRSPDIWQEKTKEL
jgi:plasmid stabilization system protein ParE